MNEEASPAPPPALPRALPPAPDPVWLQAVHMMRRNLKRTLLPLTVTQVPFAIATGAVFFYLFSGAYPNTDFGSPGALADSPSGAWLTILALGGAQSLFSLVGGAATMVTTEAIVRGQPLRLAQALDPAFTRMGGLLAFGIVFSALIIASFIGLIVLLYFVIRFGLSIHAHILDRLSPWAAAGRGWKLMRGRMFALAGVVLTAVPLALLLALVASFVISAVDQATGAASSRNHDLVLQSVTMSVAGLLFIPVGAYLATSTTLFYLTAREKFDD